MLKIENAEVLGWEHAVRGMRNPKNSWAKSDSGFLYEDQQTSNHILVQSDKEGWMEFSIGPSDQKLMTTLRNAGTDHRKFMRMITVYLDITAPLYWWKEFDTYKVGTVANSCSTMHKIAAKEFTLDDFSHEHLGFQSVRVLKDTIKVMNDFREEFIKDHEKENWWQMIQLLPSSYNQKRTVMLNYEVLANMYKSRRNHKLDEWHTLCDWIESLPYSKLITGGVVDE